MRGCHHIAKYDPNQPRDETGKWTATGSSGVNVEHKQHDERVPKELVNTIEQMVPGGITDRKSLGDFIEKLSAGHKQEMLNIMDSIPQGERPMMLLHRGDEAKGIPTTWLLGWDEAEGTDLHDHKGSEVGINVLRGTVTDRHFVPKEGLQDVVAGGKADFQVIEREVRAGTTMTIPAPYLHEVFGKAADGVREVTVHAYYPPLRAMNYYKVESGKLIYDGDWDEARPPSEQDKKRKGESMDIVNLKMASDELHIVWAEVYVPNVPDTDNEFMNDVTVREMAYKFMKDKKLGQIDIQHNNKLVPGACVVESFIARKGDPDFIEGSWVVGVYIPHAETWAKIKKGDINGFSLEAFVTRKDVIIELDLPPVLTGDTERVEDHVHKFYVAYDESGKFLGGRTDYVNDHAHVIKHGTVTEETSKHKHRFSYVDQLVKDGRVLTVVEEVEG